jgi:hypothetical protein
MPSPNDQQHEHARREALTEVYAILRRAGQRAAAEAEKCQSPGDADPATATDETAPADRKEPISDAS